MKPTKALIEALLSSAIRIEHDKDYSWPAPEHCNCGILAQELLQMSPQQVTDLRWADYHKSSQVPYGSWGQDAVGRGFCKQTGLPISAIHIALAEHGLERDDFHVLEGPDGNRTRAQVATLFRSIAEELQIKRRKALVIE